MPVVWRACVGGSVVAASEGGVFEVWGSQAVVSDLAGFLAARLDEDEAAARAAWGDADWTWRGIGRALDERPSVADTVHIARHDPARVLREVEAKRKILEAHDRPEHRCPIPVLRGAAGQLWTPDEGPCWTLRNLAAVWSDHPDYDPGWAVP